MARPYTSLPPGAKRHLESMAENGLLSESRAASALGMPFDQFKRVVADDADSKKIWENALSIERDTLLENLWALATSGDRQAAIALLAARHGFDEKKPGSGNNVTVNFSFPAALGDDEYMKTVEAHKKMISSAEGGKDA
ncbi:hypothetical protein [Thalassospira lohafexi]|uniref:Uncharacterized protein n=1 Tax=Thalassospira lohafexi TaxID=744227 RepID=A0A2N3LBA5_9PROT|nr:hypothetical protein [Thalassospira lohafexi]PKR60072.1 hypothetical protein COO92_01480 [Thalassospira lohafexi]